MCKPLNIAIAEDQVSYREALFNFLCDFENFNIVGQASEGNELLNILNKKNVDIILLDLYMKGLDGFDTAEIILQKHSRCKIILLSIADDEAIINHLLKKGVSAFVSKNWSLSVLTKAILSVQNNIQYVYDEEISHTKNWDKYEEPKKLCSPNILTNRELELIQYICKEFTNKEIAKITRLSVRTVEGIRNKCAKKIGVKNTVGIVKYALQNNLYSLK